MATFTLKITLGNDAMKDGEHIAKALEATARQISHILAGGLPGRTDIVRDENGNTVGKWSVR